MRIPSPLPQFAVAAFVLMIGLAVPGSAAAETPVACNVLGAGQVESTLNLPQQAAVREKSSLEGIAELQPAELPEAIDTECDRVYWTGSTPKSRAAVYKKARRGEGAQVGVETWGPNFGGPNGERWVEEGFTELLEEFEEGRILAFKVPGKVHRLSPAGEGYPGEGIAIRGVGPAKGLLAAIGCWWNLANHKAICILDEEQRKKPVIEDLNKFGAIAVPNFLG